MTHFLAIDLGTSSAKALLVRVDGRVVGRGSAGYPISRPAPGSAEQDPSDWWQATVSAVRQALAKADTATVAAVGLCGQMHGTVLLDSRGQLLHPAIIWPDRRSAEQLPRLEALVGRQLLLSITGSHPTSGFQGSTILWLQQQRPALWSKVKRIALPKDYLRWRLTGRWATEPSDAAGTLLFDIGARSWSGEILTGLHINADQLPPVQGSASEAGRLTQRSARAFGLPSGIPVACGAADTACALLGAALSTTVA